MNLSQLEADVKSSRVVEGSPLPQPSHTPSVAPPSGTAKPPLTYRQLFRAFSKDRMAAYSLESDTSSTDAIARYLWNLALASAFHPILHAIEVTFRNAIFDAATETTARRVYRTTQVACWLTARPSMLQAREEEHVAKALNAMSKHPRKWTAGHLISRLSFGFWVRLCDSPYEQGNVHGPQIWPAAGRRFPSCPRPKQNRADIGRAFSDLRDFRNIVAHHNPIWDRDPIGWHAKAIERLRWMNPGLAAAVSQNSTVELIYNAGHRSYHAQAEATISH